MNFETESKKSFHQSRMRKIAKDTSTRFGLLISGNFQRIALRYDPANKNKCVGRELAKLDQNEEEKDNESEAELKSESQPKL